VSSCVLQIAITRHNLHGSACANSAAYMCTILHVAVCVYVLGGGHMHYCVCVCVHACALTGPTTHQSCFMDCNNIPEYVQCTFHTYSFWWPMYAPFLCLQLQPYLWVSDSRQCWLVQMYHKDWCQK